jgi:lipopolysaccharide export LptBFGC system permease protein LptF
MLRRIFTSTWFAVLALIAAAACLALLYFKGRTNEAMAGAAFWTLAAFLIYWGATSER